MQGRPLWSPETVTTGQPQGLAPASLRVGCGRDARVDGCGNGNSGRSCLGWRRYPECVRASRAATWAEGEPDQSMRAETARNRPAPRLMLLVPVVLALAACGGSEGGTSTPSAPAPVTAEVARAVPTAEPTPVPSPTPTTAPPPTAATSNQVPTATAAPSPTSTPTAAPAPYRHGTPGGLCYGHA